MTTNIKNVTSSVYTGDGVTTSFPVNGFVKSEYTVVTKNGLVMSEGVDFVYASNVVVFFIVPTVLDDVTIFAFDEQPASDNIVIDPDDKITTITETSFSYTAGKDTYTVKGLSKTKKADFCILIRGGTILQPNIDYTVNETDITFIVPQTDGAAFKALAYSSVQPTNMSLQSDSVATIKRFKQLSNGAQRLFNVPTATGRATYCLVVYNSIVQNSPKDYFFVNNQVKLQFIPAINSTLEFIVFYRALNITTPVNDYTNFRYLNKDINYNERSLVSGWWREQINIYGMKVDYYSNKTTKENADVVYGTAMAAGFDTPRKLILLIKPESDSTAFTRFGFMTETDAVAFIHPDEFENVFGKGVEPKSGDIFEMTEYGSDRLNYPTRGPYFMEITERTDESFGAEINALAGHYVWRFKCKRYNFSHEQQMLPELGTKDAESQGIVDLTIVPAVTATDIDLESKKIFDYSRVCASNDSVYGDY